MVNTTTCVTVKPVFFHVPFISRISRAWQVCENNGPRKFEYSSVSV